MQSALLALPFGLAIGVSLGLIGGGGSILALPVLIYVLPNAPSTPAALTAAVGTSLVVIALTSAGALAAHLSSGSIDWGVAAAFTAAAVLGAFAGSRLGRRTRPYRLAQAFAVLVVGVSVFLIAESVAALV